MYGCMVKCMAVDTMKLRRRFKPARIRILMVGESPPRCGFFYDLRVETRLSKAVRSVFEGLYGAYRSKLEFLEDFKERGFYLHDLFEERGKKLNKKLKKTSREEVERLGGGWRSS